MVTRTKLVDGAHTVYGNEVEVAFLERREDGDVGSYPFPHNQDRFPHHTALAA